MSLLPASEARPTLHELLSFFRGHRIYVHRIGVSSGSTGEWSEIPSGECGSLPFKPLQDFASSPDVVVLDDELDPFFKGGRLVDVEGDLFYETGVENFSEIVDGEEGVVG